METETIPARFAAWLNERLRAREMTPADLARAMKVRNGTVSRWTNGVQRPSYEYCERIADALLMRAADVLTEAGYGADVEEAPSPLRGRLVQIAERVPDDRLPWAIAALDAIRKADIDGMKRIAEEQPRTYESDPSEE